MSDFETLLSGIKQRPGMWMGSGERSLRDLRSFFVATTAVGLQVMKAASCLTVLPNGSPPTTRWLLDLATASISFFNTLTMMSDLPSMSSFASCQCTNKNALNMVPQELLPVM